MPSPSVKPLAMGMVALIGVETCCETSETNCCDIGSIAREKSMRNDPTEAKDLEDIIRSTHIGSFHCTHLNLVSHANVKPPMIPRLALSNVDMSLSLR